MSSNEKNKHLSKAIAQQKIYEFKRQIKYKAEMYGIEVVEADRYYASSKTCSYCGHIKKDLKLSDRIYICPNCGAKLNRDLNAAINLANYKTASSKTCSYCGHIKKDLKLSDRIYICPNCGAKLNRDLNAAINLANYKTA